MYAYSPYSKIKCIYFYLLNCVNIVYLTIFFTSCKNSKKQSVQQLFRKLTTNIHLTNIVNYNMNAIILRIIK